MFSSHWLSWDRIEGWKDFKGQFEDLLGGQFKTFVARGSAVKTCSKSNPKIRVTVLKGSLKTRLRANLRS